MLPHITHWLSHSVYHTLSLVIYEMTCIGTIVMRIVIIWIISCSSLVYCQTKCSSSGEYVVISEKLAQLVIPDQSVVQPYEPDIRIPSVCDIDKTCSSLLLEVENKKTKLWEKHLWSPYNGPVRYFQLNDGGHGSDVLYGPALSASDCFKFFHIANGDLGALCINTMLDENLIVPYRIEYDEHSSRHSYELGFDIHLNIENHSPIIILNSTVIGISYFEHLLVYKLFIIYYDSASSDTYVVPSECTGPHDVQSVGQSDVVIRCADGKVLNFNLFYATFTTLPHTNVKIVSTCTNTSSFVLVQSTDNIIFNKSGTVYQLSLNTSGQPLRITSAVCHTINYDEVIYYFADASNRVYELYLGDVAAASQGSMVPHIVRDDVTRDGVITLYIDESILWGKVTPFNNSDAPTVYLIDLLTKKQSPPITVNGPNAFVQLYTAETCEPYTPSPTSPDVKQQTSNNHILHDMLQYVLPSLGTVIIIIVIIIIILIIVFVFYHRYHRPRNRQSQQPIADLEMQPIEDGQINDDRSQTPGSTDNSAAPLLAEQCVTMASGNDSGEQPHLLDSTPIQSHNQQKTELVSCNVELANLNPSTTKEVVPYCPVVLVPPSSDNPD